MLILFTYNKRQQKFNNKMVNRCRRLYEMVGAKHIYRVCNDKLYNFNTIINCFRIGTLIQMTVYALAKDHFTSETYCLRCRVSNIETKFFFIFHLGTISIYKCYKESISALLCFEIEMTLFLSLLIGKGQNEVPLFRFERINFLQ